MAKATLADSWVYDGTIYEPGERDLPADAHAALAAKGAFTPAKAAPAARAGDADPAIAEAVGEERAAALAAAGFGSPAAIAAASDEDLLAVDGIGEARLRSLRALGGGE